MNPTRIVQGKIMSPDRFHTAGQDLPLLLPNLLSLPMSRATFPSQWKTSIILPHHRIFSMHDFENFLSINHTLAPSVLVRKPFEVHLVNPLATNNPNSPSQHDFLRSDLASPVSLTSRT